MTRNNWLVIGLAYVLGLWSTSLINDPLEGFSLSHLWLLLILLLGLITSTVRFRQSKIRHGVTVLLVGMLAVVYLQLRTPQPLDNDISYQITQNEQTLLTLTGQVLTEPRLSDRQTLKFLLAVTSVNQGEQVTGKLYATLPLLQGTGIHPGQELSLKGYLYLPQPTSNDYGFDFQQYLALQGIFAGIQGIEANFEPIIPKWSWSQLRQRIVRIHLQGLGSPRGQLVSSMVLGRKAVDLPQDLRDHFIGSGLAHVLAASGFHVSLLLGIVLQLTTRIGAKPRLAIGLGTLVIYLGLTGMQASVMRACLMGAGVLLAQTLNTKVKPLGSLLLAAVIILLFEPLSISDLGFKLSFLATFGLIVTLSPLQNKLDWLPSTIATLIAIPLAASIWVLPLVSYEFNTVATYSLAVNIICTPLVVFVSLGGMFSAIAGLILPALGNAIASCLFYPTTLLMAITQFCSTLPGSNWSVGQMPRGILLIIYGLFGLIWLDQWWQKRWWLGLILPMILIVATTVHNSTQVKVSVLATGDTPVVVIRDRGRVVVINSGDEQQAKYRLLPFLARQGINQIDYGIDTDSSHNSLAAWKIVNSRTRVSKIYEIPSESNLSGFNLESEQLTKIIATKSASIEIEAELKIAKIQIGNDTWLILGQQTKADGDRLSQYIDHLHLDAQNLILVWSGDTILKWLEPLTPRMAIVTSAKVDPQTRQILRQKQSEYHNTAFEGDIRWTPQRGFIRNRKE